MQILGSWAGPYKNIQRPKVSQLHSPCAVIYSLSHPTKTKGITFKLSVSKILTPNDLPRSHRESVAPSPGFSVDDMISCLQSEGLARWQVVEKLYKGKRCYNKTSLQICKHTLLEKLAVSIKPALGRVCVSRPALPYWVTWADTGFASTAGIIFG